MASNLVRVRYAGLDFSTHEDEILARLQVKFAEVYNDFAVSSLGIMLVDVFSFGLDTISFYLDRRATDNFLTTARTRSSAARLARQLGYKAGAATASSVDVELSLVGTYAFAVPVPLGKQFTGPHGLIFEAKESTTFAAGDTSTHTITLAEGETVQTTFTSDGTANQIFEIGNIPQGKFVLGPGTQNVSQTTVVVDGEEHDEEELLVFGDTPQYEIGYNDEPTTLRFGDGIAGQIPEAGAEIQFTYFATSGIGGQATSGTIASFKEPLVVNFTSIDVLINNPEGTSGGSDPEDVSSIRANAPTVFKSRGVNVTTEDYEARAQSFVDPVFGAIAVAQAITVRGSSDDAYLSSLLADIRALAANYKPTVDVAADAIIASSAAIVVDTDGSQVNDDSLASSLSTLDTKRVDAEDDNDTARVASGIVETSSAGLGVELDNIEAEINAFTVVASSDDIDGDTKTTILNIIAAAKGRNGEINAQNSDVKTSVDGITDNLADIASEAETSETLRAAIRVSLDDIETEAGVIGVTATTLKDDVEDIGVETASLTVDVSNHVDSFLSNECKSNLVEVPVLTLDSEGFYVVPTLGLQRSLQSYLDQKKEVTQVVKVIGASNLLVEADITVLVGILTGFNEATVRSQVEAEILGVLRGRKFGSALRLSELYAPVAPDDEASDIDGVEYANIKIVGPASRVDVDGNLPINDFEVVTRGTITVTSEVVEVSTLTS